MEYFYMVIEVFLDQNGNPGGNVFFYQEEVGQLPALDRATAKFHEILGTNTIFNDRYHGACVMRSDGTICKPFDFYDRRPNPQTNQ